MEETLFECKYELNDKFTKDNIKYLCFKMPSNYWMYVAYTLIIAVGLIFAIYRTNKGVEKIAEYWTLFAVFAISWPLIWYLRYSQSIKNSRKKREEFYDGKPVQYELYITENELRYICTSANNSEIKRMVSDFVKVYETKSLIVMKSKAKFVYTIPKNGFTKGTPEEFISFLHSKGVK